MNLGEPYVLESQVVVFGARERLQPYKVAAENGVGCGSFLSLLETCCCGTLSLH